MANEVRDYINDPNWFDPSRLQSILTWATRPDVESSGEGRRQLGYEDGLAGEKPGSVNPDYLRGYQQGKQ
jgi:hypothetical protein